MECNLVWNDARDFKTNAQNEFVLKSQVWFEMHDLHEMKFSLPLYCTILNCKIQLLKYRIFKSELIFYWSSIGLVLIYKKSSLSFSCNVIGSFKQVLKSDWLLCFSKAVSLAGKKVWLRAKNVTLYPSPVINE